MKIDEIKKEIKRNIENSEKNIVNMEKDIENIQSELDNINNAYIESIENELKESKDKYLRLYAEFDTYKRRVIVEKTELIKSTEATILKSLLPVIDDFNRAKEFINESSDITSIKSGIELIQNKFDTIFNSKGLTRIQTIGLDYDADTMEAVSIIEQSDMSGKVIVEIETGYMFNNKVIRFAKVIVGK